MPLKAQLHIGYTQLKFHVVFFATKTNYTTVKIHKI